MSINNFPSERTQRIRDQLSPGDVVEITYEREEPTRPNGPLEPVEKTDTGTVTALPSNQFDRPDDAADFDYELETTGRRDGTTRTVCLERGVLRQLLYDAGMGGRDYNEFQLLKVQHGDAVLWTPDAQTDDTRRRSRV